MDGGERTVTHLVCLVTKEVDLLELFVLDVVEAIRLVPPMGEDVEGDLTADGERQSVVCELLLQDADEFCANACSL